MFVLLLEEEIKCHNVQVHKQNDKEMRMWKL